MVEAIAVHTSGLGGDSEVSFDVDAGMQVGPQRVVPLSLLAHQYPQVLPILEQHAARDTLYGYDGQFALRQRQLDLASNGQGGDGKDLDSAMLDIWEKLAEGPMPLDKLFLDRSRTYRRSRALAGLVERGYAVMSGFTPSDASHVLGYQDSWSSQAAQLGAHDLGAPRRSRLAPAGRKPRRLLTPGLPAGAAAARARHRGSHLSQAHEITLQSTSHSDHSKVWRELFLDQALGKDGQASSLAGCQP